MTFLVNTQHNAQLLSLSASNFATRLALIQRAVP